MRDGFLQQYARVCACARPLLDGLVDLLMPSRLTKKTTVNRCGLHSNKSMNCMRKIAIDRMKLHGKNANQAMLPATNQEHQ